MVRYLNYGFRKLRTRELDRDKAGKISLLKFNLDLVFNGGLSSIGSSESIFAFLSLQEVVFVSSCCFLCQDY